MATINVLDAAGGTVAVEKPLTPGRAAATASRPTVLSTEDAAIMAAIQTAGEAVQTTSEAIAASSTSIESSSAATSAAASLQNTLLTSIDDSLNNIEAATDPVPVTVTAGATAHDAAAAAVAPVLQGGYASAAAPTGVSADGDAVNAWFLRNGARAVGLTAAGALIPGDATLGLKVNVTKVRSNDEYEMVAASQTAQTLGATGATGDYIDHVLVIPSTTSPGVVTLLDSASSIPLFVGGAASISTLHPFAIDVRASSVNGAWKVTTGANVSVVAVGDFT